MTTTPAPPPTYPDAAPSGALAVASDSSAQPTNVTLDIAMADLVRAEPFETPAAQTPLALKVTAGAATGMVPLKVRVLDITTLTHPDTEGDPLNGRFAGQAGTQRLAPIGTTPNQRYPRFFGGTLKPQTEFMCWIDAGKTDDAQPLANITVQPNAKEAPAGSGLALVAPHGTKVRLRLRVEAANGSSMPGVTFSSGGNETDVELTVRGAETHEEYYRVLKDVQDVYAKAPATVRGKPEQLASLLPGAVDATALNALLQAQGEALFTEAVKAVQARAMDDRALYYARLQALVLLRRHCLQRGLPPLQFVTRYEMASRGITRLAYAAGRNALATGFDPFQLDLIPNRGNPSGVAALSLNGRTLGGAVMQTCVFPVRWTDFDLGIVEDTVRPALGSIDLLVTLSQGTPTYYDVDRFAAKRRGGGKMRDNDNQTRPPLAGGEAQEPAGLDVGPAGLPEFLETTLPYAKVITASDLTLPGPDAANCFVLNQRFEEAGGTLRQRSFTGTNDTFTASPPVPSERKKSVHGSGGGYLSNEIFYRTALLRQNRRESLSSGHFHLPVLPDTDLAKAPAQKLVAGVEQALTRFLAAVPSLPRTLPALQFPDTTIGQTATMTIDLANPLGFPMHVDRVDVPAGFTCAVQGLAIPAGRCLPVTVTFTPGTAGSFGGQAMVRGRRSLDLLFKFDVSGTAESPTATPTDEPADRSDG